MKELIEYLERKIELCTEMNMPLEKFAYTDALKKARALQLQQGGVSGRSEQFICPCCGSDKTYKTDAIHCNRCAVTTEI